MDIAYQRFQLIIFDCDGTLVDSLNSIARVANEAIAELGLAAPFAPHEIALVVGLSLHEAFSALLPKATGMQIDQVIALYKHSYQQLADAGHLEDPLFPGVRETLAQLDQAGLIVAMATGKSMRGARRTLEAHQLTTCFRVVKTADCAPSKPDPGMVLQILEETGIPAEQALMVGDTDFDMLMGRDAGVKTCAVTFGCHPRDRLRLAGPDYWLERFDQLPDLIGLA